MLTRLMSHSSHSHINNREKEEQKLIKAYNADI